MFVQLVPRRRRLWALALIASVCFQASSRAASVVLTWGAVSNAAGYAVLYGQASGLYTTRLDAGRNTTFTVSNLTSGLTYYFVAQAYDSSNNGGVYTPELVDALTGAPGIVVQPATQTAVDGGAVSFSVQATGNQPLSYQWYAGSTAISGATNSELDLAGVSVANDGNYKVAIANSLGSVTSSTAGLTVSSAVTTSGPLPTFVSQPLSQTVLAGAAVTFMSLTTGATSEQWYCNGTAIAGAASGVLMLTGVGNASAGSYYMVAQSGGGSVTSSVATLTVLSVPAITAEPAALSVSAGSAATLSVGATGGNLSYQWYDNGSAIAGATGATLPIANVSSGNAGNYTVVVSNSQGSVTSSVAALIVTAAAQPPVFVSQPSSQSVAPGASVTFMALVTGAASEQWYLNGSPISGATGGALALTSVTSANAGSYCLKASNSGGTTTSSTVTLTILAAPTITSQPASQTVAAGAAVAFSVGATGTAPFTYQWYYNGAAISGAASATLAISSAASASAGSYYAVVSNSRGSATSSAAALTVITAPSIVSQPVAQSATAGTTASFSVSVSGSTPMTFQWYQNSIAVSGATSPTLTLANVSSANAGSYHIVASNLAGQATSGSAVLTVAAAGTPPSITRQPISETLPPGIPASFSAAVSGTAPLQEQWYFNGQALNGANSNTLNVGNVVTADAGSYYLVVSNGAGTVTSGVVVLTVVTAPVITSQPVSQTVAAGSGATLQVVASGSGIMSYQWYHNGTAISGAATSTYTTSGMSAAVAGSYYVVVGDIGGSTTSATAALTEAGSFTAAAGTYNGLFYAERGTTPAIAVPTAGMLANCMVGTNGVFSAKLLLAGASCAVSGTFGSTGAASVIVARGGFPNLTVNLQLDLSGASQQLTGTVSNMSASGEWVSPLTALLATNSGVVPNGNFMMNLPTAAGAPVSAPHGYATVMNMAGQAMLMGLLFDGSMVSESTSVSAQGLIPVYFPLYNGAGLIEGWVNLSGGQPAGTLTWIRPSGVTTANPYPAGFTNSVAVN